MKSLTDIRSNFLEFFRARGHEVVASSPLVPRNDPSLLFTNAGMVQFKNVFTGQEKRPYSRATTAQKVVRAGGKHNDLDNVGYTARHLTFFEMLGNFSFGDYFKADAISYAWELVHKDFGLPKDRLCVTVYAEDDDAFDLWKKIAGFPESKIIRIPTSDNFWSMGDTGPCGPCSEIFFDHGPHIAGGPPGSAEQDGDRFVEVWNLVFMQYEQFAGGRRENLPRPSIDTGMGLERFATVMQGVHDVFDTDLFRHLIAASVELTGQASTNAHAASHRVIADHLRSSSFLIADGVLPSNEGRGYVLRRIMRRGMRHAHILGAKDPLMYRLLPALVAEMGNAYPELKRAEALISETLKLEEIRFRDTLARGLKLLDEATGSLSPGDRLAGETAFRLYDTFGFPLDLTEDALRARGITVDTDGFDAAMKRQREDARKAWSGSGEAATDTLWFSLREVLGATEFLGYDTEQAEGTIVAIVKDGARVERASAGETVRILTNQTPFYAESGGQVGDAGAMFSAKGGEGKVIDTEKKLGALHVHVVEVGHGGFAVGDAVELRVDGERRRATRANHSATHLLHAALKRVLGPHVSQKGSLVAPDRLRFDFSHPKAVTADELLRIENIVNSVIRQNSDVSTRLMPTDKAIEAGAEALFGEKYGDEVRVLTMGEDDARPYSVELCGGTHVRRLGDIGLFTILSESAVASGVRRIEALTSEGARQYLSHQAELAREAAAALKTNISELPQRVALLSDERKKLERELADARKKIVLQPAQSGLQGYAPSISIGNAPSADYGLIGNVKTDLRKVEGVSAKDLKSLADDAKSRIGSGVVAFVSVSDGKASLVVGATDDLKHRLNAVELAKRGAEALGGKGGGGRPDLAQAGGPDARRAQDALAAIEGRLAGRISFPHLLEALPEFGNATEATLELLWRAAPEQVEELDALFAAGVQSRISQGLSPELGVTYNVLQIPKEVLMQIWLLSHAAWHELLEFDKLKKLPGAHIENSLIVEAVESAKRIAIGDNNYWPARIPAFNETKHGVQAKAIRELYAMASAWAILHEMQHAKFCDDPDRPSDSIAEEILCDSYAANFLFSKIDDYVRLTSEPADKVRGKRAMGALVGLYFVAKLSEEVSARGTHPHVMNRIRLLFDRVGSEPAAHFWTFALALLWGLNPAIASEGVSIPNPTQRDLAYFALDKTFEHAFEN